MRLILLGLLSLPAAASAQSLSASGACPGPMDITASGLTPGGDVAMLVGRVGAGSDVVPRGACTGTVSGLAGIGYLGVVPADGGGNVAFSPSVPSGACDKNIQLLDLATCTMTNVVNLSDGGVIDPPDACGGGADLLSIAPGNDMVLCDDPTDVTCEQDFGSLCPADWHLCSMDEYNNRNDGWDEAVPAERALGVIYCRPGLGGAGHFTVPDSTSGVVSLGEDEVFNCYYGSSRATCEAGYGCNEQSAKALCCAPSASCGNGVVDSAEEQCDDGNGDDTDACLSNCTHKVPTDFGFSGTNCG